MAHHTLEDMTYTLCAGHTGNGEPCPFFIEGIDDYQMDGSLAEFVHLTRGTTDDDERDDHEPIPGEARTLADWRRNGPARVRERFIA